MSCTLFIDWYLRNPLGSTVSSLPLGNITADPARSEVTEAEDPSDRPYAGADVGVGGGDGKEAATARRGAIGATTIGANTGLCLAVELLLSSTIRRTSGITASRSLRLMKDSKASTISDSSARRLYSSR